MSVINSESLRCPQATICRPRRQCRSHPLTCVLFTPTSTSTSTTTSWDRDDYINDQDQNDDDDEEYDEDSDDEDDDRWSWRQRDAHLVNKRTAATQPVRLSALWPRLVVQADTTATTQAAAVGGNDASASPTRRLTCELYCSAIISTATTPTIRQLALCSSRPTTLRSSTSLPHATLNVTSIEARRAASTRSHRPRQRLRSAFRALLHSLAN